MPSHAIQAENTPAMFQQLMNKVVDGVPNCPVYIDDVVVVDTSWKECIENMQALIGWLDDAGLDVILEKC